MTVPPLAPRVSQLVGTVYSNLVSKFGSYEGERYPLHVGDTWMQPPVGCRTEDVLHADHPSVNKYTPVPGHPDLLAALATRAEARTGVPTAPEDVVVTAGATAGYAVALGAIVAPGSELMICAPAWPLIAGTTKAFGGVPVHVPFFDAVTSPEDVAPALDACRSERSVGIYVNTPSNPTGRVLDRAVLEAIVAYARAHGLWIVSDEVYEDIVFEGTHVYLRTLAPERTISAWSFSKGYGMAGNRCGYVVGPREVIAGARKLATYTYYCAPHVAQIAALRALGPEGDAWVAEARSAYQALGYETADRLGVPRPQGSTFLFVDLRPFVGEEPLDQFLGRCVSRGLLIAPGNVFGPYPHHVRVCYTAVAPDVTRRGVEVLAELLGV